MITVDLDSPEPIEDQIRREIQAALARGDVKRGDALPSVRQLAGDLGVHWNTVARAYRRLRDDGLLSVGRGRAVTVRSREIGGTPGASKELLRALLDEALAQARLRGLSYKETQAVIHQQLSAWRGAWKETPQ